MNPERQIIVGEKATNHQLSQLGLNPVLIWDTMMAGRNAALTFTPNDPASGTGIAIWSRMTRALRDGTASLGWQKRMINLFETTVHTERGLSIVVMRGDDHVGNPKVSPSSRTKKRDLKKGRRAYGIRDAIKVNNYLEALRQNPHWSHAMFDIESSQEDPLVQTWVLLHNVSPENIVQDNIRLELSLPIGMTKGRVGIWGTRIIIPRPALLDVAEKPVVRPSGGDSGSLVSIADAIKVEAKG